MPLLPPSLIFTDYSSSSSSSSPAHCIIKDVHLACLEGAREESLHLLRRFYKGEEIFLDMFEDEYRSMTTKPLNVEYLMMDASVLLPPTGTPLTGIDFVKRLPCGGVEKTRRAIRVFFMLRSLSLQLQGEPETQLPLTRSEDLINTDDVLDLYNSDLIACMVVLWLCYGCVVVFLSLDNSDLIACMVVLWLCYGLSL
eukprot:XP_014040935.1 PREDICTED: protein CLEC16A-like [Salmo salar]